MAVPIANAFGNGSSFITGVYGIVNLADDMVENLVSDLNSHIEKAEAEARDRMRSSAERLDGWSDISSTLSVTVDHGRINIDAGNDAYSRSIASDLEYGTMDSAPIPLIRMSVGGISEFINSTVNAELRKDVPIA